MKDIEQKMKSDTLNIVFDFNPEEIPEFYEAMLFLKKNPNEIIRHSIYDFPNNKLYHLVFPKHYNPLIHTEIIESTEILVNGIENNITQKGKAVDWQNDSRTTVDELMEPLNQFFNLLETNCDRMCCGIQAFNTSPEKIQEVQSKILLDVTIINQIIAKIESIQSVIIEWEAINQYFEKTEFIKLLKNLNQALLKNKNTV